MKSKIDAIIFDINESFKDLGHEIKIIQEKQTNLESKIKQLERNNEQ